MTNCLKGQRSGGRRRGLPRQSDSAHRNQVKAAATAGDESLISPHLRFTISDGRNHAPHRVNRPSYIANSCASRLVPFPPHCHSLPAIASLPARRNITPLIRQKPSNYWANPQKTPSKSPQKRAFFCTNLSQLPRAQRPVSRAFQLSTLFHACRTKPSISRQQ
jgi:hypothetical protein